MYGRPINLNSPMNASHPQNAGCRFWWLGLPARTGQLQAWDLCGVRTVTLSDNNASSPLSHFMDGRGFISIGFDGSNDVGFTQSVPTTNVTNWSMAAWIYPAALSQFSKAVYNGIDANGYGFGMNAGNGSGVGDKLTGLFGGVAWYDSGYTFPSANRWYHVLMARDSATTRFWVDGVQTANTSASTPGTPTDRLAFGAQMITGSGPGRYWNGRVSDVKVWDRYVGDHAGQIYGQSLRGYRTTNSPLNWIANTAINTVAAPAGNRRRRVLMGAA